MPFLTPDTPLPTLAGVTIQLPDSEYLHAVFWGHFLELSDPENWEENGSATPEEIAELFALAFESSA